MYENKVDYDNGLTYIMGNSGPKFYSKSDVSYADIMLGDTSTYQIVNIWGNSLEVLTYDENHELVDSYTGYPKNRAASPPAVKISGDINGDGAVTYADVLLVIEAILRRDYTNMDMDIDGNGVIEYATRILSR